MADAISASTASSIEQFNPLSHMSETEYIHEWTDIFNTVLCGFWGHALFFVLIVMAFWVGVRQRNPVLAAVFLASAAIVAYGAGLMGFIHSITG